MAPERNGIEDMKKIGDYLIKWHGIGAPSTLRNYTRGLFLYTPHEQEENRKKEIGEERKKERARGACRSEEACNVHSLRLRE